MPSRTLTLLIACLLAGPAAAATAASSAKCSTLKLSAAKPSAFVIAKQVTFVRNLGPDPVLVKEHNLKLAPTDLDLWVGHPGARVTALLATGSKSASVKFCSTNCNTSECLNEVLK